MIALKTFSPPIWRPVLFSTLCLQMAPELVLLLIDLLSFTAPGYFLPTWRQLFSRPYSEIHILLTHIIFQERERKKMREYSLSPKFGFGEKPRKRRK